MSDDPGPYLPSPPPISPPPVSLHSATQAEYMPSSSSPQAPLPRTLNSADRRILTWAETWRADVVYVTKMGCRRRIEFVIDHLAGGNFRSDLVGLVRSRLGGESPAGLAVAVIVLDGQT